MKKYIWAFLITIPIILVAWNMTNSAEESEITHNVTVEKNQGYQPVIRQEEDVIVSAPEVEEGVEPEDIQTEDSVETEEDAESDSESAIYQKRYEEFQARISEARDYIAGKLPDTDISDEELPKGVCLLDICEGDLDGDDKQDFAVVLEYELGYEYFLDDEFGLPQEWIRPIYVYTYADDTGYQCRYEHPDLISAKGFGGMWGDSYAGMEIKEGTLRVSDYGGSSGRWGDDLFFEIKGEEFLLKEYVIYEGSTLNGNGMQSVRNYEEGTCETYALASMNEPLLIYRDTFETQTIPFQEAEMHGFQWIANVGKLPYLSYDEGYAGLLDDIQKNAARHTAEEALDIVKEEKYPDMHRVDIVCEEVIFDNYETLLGYEPPRYYYEDDAGNMLIYESQDITAGHTHEVTYDGPDYTYCSYELFDETGEIVSEERGTTRVVYHAKE